MPNCACEESRETLCNKIIGLNDRIIYAQNMAVRIDARLYGEGPVDTEAKSTETPPVVETWVNIHEINLKALCATLDKIVNQLGA